MAKKQMRLTTGIVKKNPGYIPGGLESLISDVQSNKDEGAGVRMNFEVNEELRHAFKAKAVREGKKVKDVLAAFMAEYINKKEG
ncbi:MAG: hypothetical protein ACNA7Y_00180 [Gammaproteobacteria bacterium]